MDLLKSIMFEKDDPLATTNGTFKTSDKKLGTTNTETKEEILETEKEKKEEN